METKTALIGIVVENTDSVDKLNSILHDYKGFILGRMGLPHPSKELSIISIAMEAPADTISALSGKLGALPGISTKTIYAKA
ncbi:iron-only hydrogenase system regulator [bacterium 210820-DFI.6.37]|nr:iron-only hydrogenase system regulator [bacterium 210820-DFI.6.37]